MAGTVRKRQYEDQDADTIVQNLDPLDTQELYSDSMDPTASTVTMGFGQPELVFDPELTQELPDSAKPGSEVRAARERKMSGGIRGGFNFRKGLLLTSGLSIGILVTLAALYFQTKGLPSSDSVALVTNGKVTQPLVEDPIIEPNEATEAALEEIPIAVSAVDTMKISAADPLKEQEKVSSDLVYNAETAKAVETAQPEPSRVVEYMNQKPVHIEERQFMRFEDGYRGYGSEFVRAPKSSVSIPKHQGVTRNDLSPSGARDGRYIHDETNTEWQAGFEMNNPGKNVKLGSAYTKYLGSASKGKNVKLKSIGSNKSMGLLGKFKGHVGKSRR